MLEPENSRIKKYTVTVLKCKMKSYELLQFICAPNFDVLQYTPLPYSKMKQRLILQEIKYVNLLI